MSGDTVSETPPAVSRDRFVHAEARLYAASPLGFLGTTFLILALAFGSYVLIAETTQRPALFEPVAFCAEDASAACSTAEQERFAQALDLPFDGSRQRYELEPVSWIGFVLSMILTTALALSEIARRMWNSQRTALIDALPKTAEADARALSHGVPTTWKSAYASFFFAGAIGGILFNVIMMVVQGATPAQYLGSIGLWFLIFSPFLYGLGLRAGVDLARETGEIRRLIDTHLHVDLYNLDALHVFGRIGLRGALSWMVMAAVLLLFVVDPRQVWMAVPAILLAGAGGVFILTSAINPVHRKIHAAKEAELQRTRQEIARLRDLAFDGNAQAGAALAGLTDYERWIQERPEWPLSTSTTTRFALYILIPIVPIFASYGFEKLADGLLRTTS